MLKVIKERSSLVNTRNSLKKGEITIGVIGGSISVADTESRWPEPVIAWFLNKCPGLRINVENAAIGASGSEFGVFRVEDHIISKKCDLVFVEYAVNDGGIKKEKRMRTREGLLRKLLFSGSTDVVVVYTFNRPMYDRMMSGIVPDTISDFEILTEHYGLNSVWMGLKALNDLKNGKMKWKEWLPDGHVHPESRGSLSYAESVIEFLDSSLNKKEDEKNDVLKIPTSYDKNCWEETYQTPFEDLSFTGPWVVRRWTKTPWYNRIIQTASPIAKFEFDFMGRGISLGFAFAKVSADFRYRIDHGEWKEYIFDRPTWCPEEEIWHRIINIADDLTNKNHHFEYEVFFRSNDSLCEGTNTKIGLIGIVK